MHRTYRNDHDLSRPQRHHVRKLSNCARLARCRSGDVTTVDSRKFDYVFASVADFDDPDADLSVPAASGYPLSDHRMYRADFAWRPDGEAPSLAAAVPTASALREPNPWVNAVDQTAGDFTGDGAPDLVLRCTDGSVRVFPSDGHGGFGPGWQLVTADAGWWDAQSIAAGDFTGDGKADLLVRWTAGSVFVYPGDGTGGIGGSLPVLTVDGGTGLWADAVDVVAGHFTPAPGNEVVIRWKDGRVTLHDSGVTGKFALRREVVPASGGGWSDAREISAPDFTGDGKADLLVRWFAGSVFLYPGTGDGGFTNSQQVADAGAWSSVRATTAADFDRDGRADVLLRDTEFTSFRPGTGVGFGEARVLQDKSPGGWLDAAEVRSADFDRDGIGDVLVRWNSGRVVCYRDDGSGGLTSATELVGTTNGGWSDARSITAGDFNGDGYPDLLVRWTAGSVFMYPNNRAGGLDFAHRVQVLGAGAWSTAVDVVAADFTPAAGDELVIRWADGSVSRHDGNAASGFAKAGDVRPAGSGGWGDAVEIAAADLTGDGRADLLVRWRAGSVFQYANDGQGAFPDSAPAQPAGAWTDVTDTAPVRTSPSGPLRVVLRHADGSVTLSTATAAVAPAGSPAALTLHATDARGRVAYYAYTVDDAWTPAAAIRADAHLGSARVLLPALPPSLHTIRVVAVDLAGNSSQVTATTFTTA